MTPSHANPIELRPAVPGQTEILESSVRRPLAGRHLRLISSCTNHLSTEFELNFAAVAKSKPEILYRAESLQPSGFTRVSSDRMNLMGEVALCERISVRSVAREIPIETESATPLQTNAVIANASSTIHHKDRITSSTTRYHESFQLLRNTPALGTSDQSTNERIPFSDDSMEDNSCILNVVNPEYSISESETIPDWPMGTVTNNGRDEMSGSNQGAAYRVNSASE